MNKLTREMLINCGMIPVSAISLDGSITRGYWHSISCGEGECFVALPDDSYILKSFPVIKQDSGKAYAESINQGKVGIIL